MKKLTQQERAVIIERAIRLAWESAQSHLVYTHSGKQVRGENHAFHKRCVRDYIEIMSLLSKLY